MANAKMNPKYIPPTRLDKASWESLNEGVHERVNFDDTIWGFDLSGGSKYGIPLRVTRIKKDSRAEKAGIRKGDMLISINELDTSKLTLKEAHDIILESGISIRLSVTCPEDTETTYNTYVDEEEELTEEEKERIRLEQEAMKRKIICKTNSNWSLQWPWITKRALVYKESNCFLVPSIYEEKHKDRSPAVEEHNKIILEPKEGLVK